ncbi:helix-turn-helix transcriptional regulator [Kribbella solani]|uniref:DNA-binding NarL/FixJ family response regulator n=1 Tax=Kribbella solani TaxID=236067 RepID=A0A841DJ83_9ACTN|nr:response regulator transcription factor [Kribbella solani]MBB5977649.1 DNA-binding NarL/FixJ family response regulator [Kribbella solani]
MTEQRIPVWVKALDPLSQFGLVHTLRVRPEVCLLSDDELDVLVSRRTAPPVVALVAVDALDTGAVQVLREVAHRGCQRTVLIGGAIDDDALLGAVDLGVSGVLRRADATPDRVVRLVQAAATNDGSLPPMLLGRLLGNVTRLPVQRSTQSGQSVLSDRETQVLRLVADGKDTQEIARTLSYSERTVKNVLHDVTSRLQLRNRSHAVAYALRQGFI